jgi:hypothetical protein
MGRKIIVWFAVVTGVCAHVGSGLAGSSTYECVIKTEYRLADNGLIDPVPKDVATSIGDRFMVDQDTGRIMGRGTDNKIAKEFRVIQRDDAIVSSVVSTYWGGTTDYLQINQFVEAPEKPFLLVFKGFWVHGGTCR